MSKDPQKFLTAALLSLKVLPRSLSAAASSENLLLAAAGFNLKNIKRMEFPRLINSNYDKVSVTYALIPSNYFSFIEDATTQAPVETTEYNLRLTWGVPLLFRQFVAEE